MPRILPFWSGFQHLDVSLDSSGVGSNVRMRQPELEVLHQRPTFAIPKLCHTGRSAERWPFRAALKLLDIFRRVKK